MDSLNKAIVALLLGVASASALAADTDAQHRLNELLSDPAYQEAWRDVVEDESRLPEWVMNLSGTAPPMKAVEDDGDKFLVGELCEAHNCSHQRLYVAFSWNKEDAWALYVQVPDGLPSDKSPSRHASYRWLGEPDEEVRRILDEQLKADPNWY